MSLVDSSADGMHFLGPLVCTPAQHVPGEVTAYQLIDGQQRLTTLTLVLISLRDLCREKNLTDLAEEIHEDFLVHKRRSDLQHYKIVPRVADREALIAILQGKELGEFKDFRLLKGLRFFGRELHRYSESDLGQRVPKLFRALTAQMSLVVITLAGENPYQVGELTRLRRCSQCQKWLFARFRHQTFCSTKCQQKNYTQSDAWKAHRRAYMRRYYQKN
jgi:hypothetical protein